MAHLPAKHGTYLKSHRVSGTTAVRREASGKVRPEYRIWIGMRERCSNPRHASYENYGAKGISVHPDFNCFAKFFAHVGERPTPAHTIERIRTSGNYEPGNVCWATYKEQSLTNSRTVLVEIDGRSVALLTASELLGLSYRTLRQRYARGLRGDALLAQPRENLRRRPAQIQFHPQRESHATA